MLAKKLPHSAHQRGQTGVVSRRAKAIRALAGILVLACLLCAGFFQTTALAGTAYVDGVSDQSLPDWDGSFPGWFGEFFQRTWVGEPPSHIKFARYIVSWNLMAKSFPKAYEYERNEFEDWLIDVEKIGLIPDIALTTYHNEYPVGPSEYQEQLTKILEWAKSIGYTIPYVEPWNEPNAQGNVSATRAAEYANKANTSCKVFWECDVVLGNMFDGPKLIEYEKNYESHLEFNSGIWGVHPYQAVEEETTSRISEFKADLPSGSQLWFTEVGVQQCVYKNGATEERGPRWQAEHAKWLADELIHKIGPEHVFYYEYLFKFNEPAPCNSGEANDSLYQHGSDPNAPDEPKPAAAFIYNGKGFPWGYTGGAQNITATGATLTVSATGATLTASVYPGGFIDSKYYFEYGPTTSYGLRSSEGDSGSGEGYEPLRGFWR